MDAATLNQHLEKHLRVSTFPLGIKSLKPGEPLPDKVKIPLEAPGREGGDLPGHLDRPPVRLDDGVLRGGPLVPHRQGGVRLRGAQRILHLRGAGRRDVRLVQGSGGGIRKRPRQVRPRRVRPRGRRPLEPRQLRPRHGARLRQLRPGAATPERGPLQAGRIPEKRLLGPRRLHRHRHQGEEDRRAAGDPAVLRRPDLRHDRGRRDGVHLPLRPRRGGRRGAGEDPRRRRPVPVPIYLRFQADFPKSYQELEKIWAESKK